MKSPANNYIYGFSLVELIVVITIFSIMSGVSIFNYNKYRDNIETNNIAQDIALTIRQAQVYGLAGSDDNINIAKITDDKSIRGVNIHPYTNTLIIYEDINRDFVYNSAYDRIIDERTIRSQDIGFLGADLCPTTANCGNIQTDTIDIVFQRPYPDAFISLDGDPSDQYNIASILV
jgi:prepilin-type N-terminal cleavage/methylation domain-containing protein